VKATDTDVIMILHLTIAEALTVKYDVEVAGLKLMPVSTYTLSGSDTVSYPYRTGTRCSAIAERPRCRVRYSFRQK